MMLSLGASVVEAAIWPLSQRLFSRYELGFKKSGLIITMLIFLASAAPSIYASARSALIGFVVAGIFLSIITIIERKYHFHFLAIAMLAVHNLSEGMAGAIDYNSLKKNILKTSAGFMQIPKW